MPYTNISEVNAAFKNINKNINELEKLSNRDDCNDEHVRNVLEETNKLLHGIENASCRKVLRIIKIRRKRRLSLKRKRELANQKNEMCTASSIALTPVVSGVTLRRSDADPSKKETLLLMKRADAQRFVHTFDLLEKLHQARSQNTSDTNKLANKLATLRRIWLNELRSSISPKANQKSLEGQWEKMLFGDNKPTDHQNLKDFLRIRQIWDSYISQSKLASRIPNGWVMPQATS